MAVVTSDGHELGRVKATFEGFFEVDAPLARDYWLSFDDVEGEREDVLLLRFAERDVEAMKLEPDGGPSGVDDPGRYSSDPRTRLRWLAEQRPEPS